MKALPLLVGLLHLLAMSRTAIRKAVSSPPDIANHDEQLDEVVMGNRRFSARKLKRIKEENRIHNIFSRAIDRIISDDIECDIKYDSVPPDLSRMIISVDSKHLVSLLSAKL